MFKKSFAKYARAVSDGQERARLYKKYRIKTIALIVYFVICLCMVAGNIAFELSGEQDWFFVASIVLVAAFVVGGIVTLCLVLSFRKAYNAVLNRPAGEDEMPEVVSYRRKMVQDKKSTFKKLWWAWLVFGVCVAAFIACVAVDVANDPYGEDIGMCSTVGILLLVAGAMVLVYAYLLNAASKRMKGKAIEQQTAREAEVIDRAQGRKSEYQPLNDVNAKAENTYEYLFPDEQLRAAANAERVRRTKIITRGLIICVVVALVAAIALFYAELAGYVLPAVFTVLFGGLFIISAATGGKLKAMERQQKAELESNPDYAKHFEWYKIHESFYKFKGKVYIIFIVVGVALGWVFAVLFPNEPWSIFALLVPLIIGALLSNKFVKDMRKKAIPVEREIDAARFSLHDVCFCAEEGSADENTRVLRRRQPDV